MKMMLSLVFGGLLAGCGGLEGSDSNASGLIWETRTLDPAACTMLDGARVTPWPGLLPKAVKLAWSRVQDNGGQVQEGSKILFFRGAVGACSSASSEVTITIIQDKH